MSRNINIYYYHYFSLANKVIKICCIYRSLNSSVQCTVYHSHISFEATVFEDHIEKDFRNLAYNNRYNEFFEKVWQHASINFTSNNNVAPFWPTGEILLISTFLSHRRTIRYYISLVMFWRWWCVYLSSGLWGLVNNAGIGGYFARPEWLTLKDYKDVEAVNLHGLIDVSITFLPLIKQAKGRLVNTASVFGRYTFPLVVPYCISKHGVEVFTDALRLSIGPNNLFFINKLQYCRAF